MSALKFLVVPPKVKHTATVIFLHGLGDTGAGWEPVARFLQQQDGLGHIRWILPHAERRPITFNWGAILPGWYDIVTLSDMETRPEDEPGMLSSARAINGVITSELDTYPEVDASRIVLGGFSQGGAMSLLTGLTTERKLGGIIALSSYLPLRHKIGAMLSDHAKKLPIFMGHGNADEVVLYKYGHGSYLYMKDKLGIPTVKSGEAAGAGIRFEEYEDMGHSSCPEELEHITGWLKEAIP